MRHPRLLLLFLSQMFLLNIGQAWGQGQQVFQIGTKDQSYTEFARNRKPGISVVYRVGQSSAAKDWYAYQPGTLDYEVGRSSREQDWTVMHPGSEGELSKDPVPVPFEVDFDLPAAPSKFCRVMSSNTQLDQ